MINSVESFSSI